MPTEDVLEAMQVVFSALGDRTRLKVMFVLVTTDELCVCDVAHAVDISVSAASHHLRKLRDLRILKYRTDGKMAYYSLRDPIAAALFSSALKAVKGGAA